MGRCCDRRGEWGGEDFMSVCVGCVVGRSERHAVGETMVSRRKFVMEIVIFQDSLVCGRGHFVRVIFFSVITRSKPCGHGRCVLGNIIYLCLGLGSVVF